MASAATVELHPRRILIVEHGRKIGLREPGNRGATLPGGRFVRDASRIGSSHDAFELSTQQTPSPGTLICEQG
jgi:hypothetical protein